MSKTETASKGRVFRIYEHSIELEKYELYELNDSIREVVERMCSRGQTPLEIEYGSLGTLWGVWMKVVAQTLGTTDTPSMRAMQARVMASIRDPKILI